MSETLNIDEQIAFVEQNIELQEYYIKRSEALEKLKATEEFKLAIADGYINEELDRLFNMLAAPRVIKQEEKEIITDQIDSIKYFSMFIGNEDYPGTASILASNAKKIIADEELVKQELLKQKNKEQ